MSPSPVESITSGELLHVGGGFEAFDSKEFSDSQLGSEMDLQPDVDARIESFLTSKGVERGLGRSAMANILSLEV